jgi:hypothetical protein
MTQAQLTERALSALKAWVHSMPIQNVRKWTDEERALYAAAADLMAPRWRCSSSDPTGAVLLERTEHGERAMATGRPEDIARLCERLNDKRELGEFTLGEAVDSFTAGVRS